MFIYKEKMPLNFIETLKTSIYIPTHTRHTKTRFHTFEHLHFQKMGVLFFENKQTAFYPPTAGSGSRRRLPGA